MKTAHSASLHLNLSHSALIQASFSSLVQGLSTSMKIFPGFYKPLLPGFIHGINIPPYFLRYHLRRGNGRAVLRRGGREWAMKITDGVITAEGWSRFATDNGLEVGDIVKLDLVKEVVFEASVLDGATGCGKQMKRGEEDDGDEYPSFTSSMKAYNRRGKSVNIPIGFARTYGLCDKREIVVTDEGGRIRAEVKLSKYANSGRFRYHIMYGGRRGCPSIFRDCGVEQGDAFKIQLVENGAVPVVRVIPLGRT